MYVYSIVYVINNNICDDFLKDNITVNVYDNFIDKFKCVCVCVCVCDDFLKGNIYDCFRYKSFIRKILIATVYFFHSSFLNFIWRHFLISYFLVKGIYMTVFFKGKIIVPLLL